MNRKMIFIISVFVLIFCLGINCFAQNTDLFYYTANDARIEQALLEAKTSAVHPDALYIENEHLKNGEKADMSKATYDLSKIYAEYNWTAEKVIAFMEAEDKAAYLKTLTPHMFFFSCYYDGVRLDDFYTRLIYDSTSGKYKVASGSSSFSSYTKYVKRYIDKDELINLLEKDNITGYEIINSITVYGMAFTIAEKDGETVAIYMPGHLSKDSYKKGFWDAYDENKEVLDGRVLTISQMEAFFESYTKYVINSSEETTAIMGGSSGEIDPSTLSQPNTTKNAKSTQPDSNEENTTPSDTAAKTETADKSSNQQTEQVDKYDEKIISTEDITAEHIKADYTNIGALAAEDDVPKSKAPWIYAGIGTGVLILAAVLIITLAQKKKKS